MRRADDMPEPDEAARACSLRLAECIRDEMHERGGLMPFDRFMELALYAPGLGYYVAGSRKFGAAGDFVTAPEISPLFGRCIARQCAQVLAELGGGDILEFGPGSGALAVSMMARLAELGQLPERYLMLELSPDLQQRQRAAIAGLPPDQAARFHWLDRLPEDFCGVMLANEVLDAMPVSRFRIQGGAVHEVFVHWDGAGFSEWTQPTENLALRDAVEQIRTEGRELSETYTSEVNLRAKPWIESLAGSLREGVVLLIDYAYTRSEYYLPERVMGTLMCHYRQRAHADPYRLIGLQDMTAYVDFSIVAQTAVGAGLNLAGYSSQANFLMACGLDELLAESDPMDVASHMDLVQQAKRLILPTDMGERFQVLGLSKAYDKPLVGFSLRDMRERL